MGRDRRGKLGSLAALLREHGEAVEADFHQYYGLDLLDLWRGELPVRKVAVLARMLPRDSRTMRLVAGPAGEWSVHEHLLAGIFDRLGGIHVQIARSAGDRRARPPKPIPRPGDRTAPRSGSGMTPTQTRARLEDLQRRDQERLAAS